MPPRQVAVREIQHPLADGTLSSVERLVSGSGQVKPRGVKCRLRDDHIRPRRPPSRSLHRWTPQFGQFPLHATVLGNRVDWSHIGRISAVGNFSPFRPTTRCDADGNCHDPLRRRSGGTGLGGIADSRQACGLDGARLLTPYDGGMQTACEEPADLRSERVVRPAFLIQVEVFHSPTGVPSRRPRPLGRYRPRGSPWK